LTKVAEKIITEEGGQMLQKRVVELEQENSWVKATAMELHGSVDGSAETIAVMPHSMDAGVEEYNLLLEGNKSLLAKRNALRERSEDLEAELTKARTSEYIAALEAKVKSTEAHIVDIAASDEKCLSDFENELIKDLAELHILYEHNILSIRGMWSPMPEGEPSFTDYIRWLFAEVTGLLEVFVGVNEKIISAAVEGTLVMAGGSVDLAAQQASIADSGGIFCHGARCAKCRTCSIKKVVALLQL
jgi:hypothetical protein